jgi:hypothetical protein
MQELKWLSEGETLTEIMQLNRGETLRPSVANAESKQNLPTTRPVKSNSDIWGFHGGEHLDCGLLGYNTV